MIWEGDCALNRGVVVFGCEGLLTIRRADEEECVSSSTYAISVSRATGEEQNRRVVGARVIPTAQVVGVMLAGSTERLVECAQREGAPGHLV